MLDFPRWKQRGSGSWRSAASLAAAASICSVSLPWPAAARAAHQSGADLAGGSHLLPEANRCR